MHYQIDDLRCLLAVVRAGSMTRAAPKLGISTAAVSRRVDRLERDLGLHLLNRSPQGIGPTSDAEKLLQASAPHLLGLEEAVVETLHGEQALAGNLRITAPRAISEIFLSDWLNDFVLEHPALHLELIVSDTWLDLVADSIDIAIRVGQLPDSDDTLTHLGHVSYSLVPGPHRAEEVRAHLAHYGWSGLEKIPAVIACPIRSWRAYHQGSELVVDPLAVYAVNSLSLAASAVNRGVGIGYLPSDIAARADLDTIPLEDFGLTPTQRPVLVVTPRGQRRRRKVALVVEMIKRRIRAEGPTNGISPNNRA